MATCVIYGTTDDVQTYTCKNNHTYSLSNKANEQIKLKVLNAPKHVKGKKKDIIFCRKNMSKDIHEEVVFSFLPNITSNKFVMKPNHYICWECCGMDNKLQYIKNCIHIHRDHNKKPKKKSLTKKKPAINLRTSFKSRPKDCHRFLCVDATTTTNSKRCTKRHDAGQIERSNALRKIKSLKYFLINNNQRYQKERLKECIMHVDTLGQEYNGDLLKQQLQSAVDYLYDKRSYTLSAREHSKLLKECCMYIDTVERVTREAARPPKATLFDAINLPEDDKTTEEEMQEEVVLQNDGRDNMQEEVVLQNDGRENMQEDVQKEFVPKKSLPNEFVPNEFMPKEFVPEIHLPPPMNKRKPPGLKSPGNLQQQQILSESESSSNASSSDTIAWGNQWTPTQNLGPFVSTQFPNYGNITPTPPSTVSLEQEIRALKDEIARLNMDMEEKNKEIAALQGALCQYMPKNLQFLMKKQ